MWSCHMNSPFNQMISVPSRDLIVGGLVAVNPDLTSILKCFEDSRCANFPRKEGFVQLPLFHHPSQRIKGAALFIRRLGWDGW